MDQFIVLSLDPYALRAEHCFLVSRNVPGQEMVLMTGDYFTKVFEGPYKNAPKWEKQKDELLYCC